MFYYDPDFGYIAITGEKFGGHILIGRGPVVPHDPESIEEQRYTANDRMRWREVDELPQEWAGAFGITAPVETAGDDVVYDITIASPRVKNWQIVFAVFVWLCYWILWNSTR